MAAIPSARATLGSLWRNIFAKYGQASRIGLERSRHDFDERGFSRAVLADQRVDFSRPQLERYIF